MAVVGDAYIVVRAITNRVRDDIRDGFRDVDRVGEDAGSRAGESFSRGLRRTMKSGAPGFDVGTRLADESVQVRKVFNQLQRQLFMFGPAVAYAAGAIGSLVGGLAAIGTVASSAAQGLIAIGGIFGGLLQGALTLTVALNGVGDALKAGLKPPSGGGDLTGYLRAVEDARLRLLELEASVPQVLEEAKQAAIEAAERAADAILAEQRALRSYNDAQKNTLKALERLNEAREEARERIQQLRFETEGAAISEARARLAFEKARDALQRVQDLPPNSRARQEAELAFAEADLNLRRAIDRNADLKQEEEAATAAGVEGSREVVAAKEAIEQATQAELDAQIALVKAIRDSQRAQEAANQAALDAQAGGRAEQEINKKIAEAREALRRAEEDLARARKGGVDAFAQALKKLSPEAQAFVKYLLSIKDAFKVLKFAAGRQLFGPLQNAIENIRTKGIQPLIPLLERTGGTVGKLIENFSKTATSARNIQNLTAVWESNDRALQSVGTALSNFYTILLNVFRAAGPLTERFAAWILKVSESGVAFFESANGLQTLTDKFNYAGDILARLGGTFSDIWGGFKAIGTAAREEGGAVDTFLAAFETGAEKFRVFFETGVVGSGEAQQSLGDFLTNSVTNMMSLVTVISDVVEILGRFGGDPNIGTVSGKISTDLLPKIESIGTAFLEVAPQLAEFADKVLSVTVALTDSEGMRLFFETMNRVLDVVVSIVESGAFQQFVEFVAPIKGVLLALGGIGLAGGLVGKSLLGAFLLPIRGLSKLKTVATGGGKGFFKGLITSSSEARKEFRKQMQVDALKEEKVKKVGWASKLTGKAMDGMKRASALLRTGLGALGTGLKTLVGGIGKAIVAFGKFALTLLTNPIFLVIAAVVILAILIYKNWDKIKEWTKKLVEWMKEKFQALVAWFKELPGKILDALKGFATSVWEFIKKYHPVAIIWRLVTENWDAIKTWFTEMPGKIVEFLSGLRDKVKQFIHDYHPVLILWRLVTENWERIKAWFVALPGRVKDAIVGLSTTVLNFIRDNHPILILFRFVREKWPEVQAWFSEKIEAIVGFFRAMPDRIRRVTSNLWDGLKDSFRTAINWLINKWNNFRLDLRVPTNVATTALGIAGFGFTIDTPNLPLLARGGTVLPQRGGTLAVLAEAGRPERVEPLDSDGLSRRDRAMIDYLTGRTTLEGTGVTVNVHAAEHMDERALAALVSRQLAFQMRRGAA